MTVRLRKGSVAWIVWGGFKTLAVVFALWAFVVLLMACA